MNRSRNEQVAFQLRQSGLDALVCTLPKNVLLLSGYWPVVGTGAAIALLDGEVRLIIPEDEQEFAVQSRASNVQTFNPSSLEKLTNPTEAILEPLRVHLRQFGEHHRIGYEHGADSEPASYAAMHLYQSTMPELIAKAAPGANIIAADHLLKELRSIKTEDELSAIRTACRIAQHGFEQGVKAISPGNTEIEAAAEIRAHFVAGLRRSPGVRRAEAFVFVMSGKNSAKAHGLSPTRREKLSRQAIWFSYIVIPQLMATTRISREPSCSEAQMPSAGPCTTPSSLPGKLRCTRYGPARMRLTSIVLPGLL